MATSTSTRVRPVGSRLCATKVQLVSCLRKKVEKNKSSFIETKNVYECDPWLLVHEPNPLFKKNEWYYFVQRSKRGGTTAKRTVPRNGDNEGGTWKTTGKIKNIKDKKKKKVVVGYMQSLVYNKNVSGKKVKTNWLMTEYSLNNGGNKEFQDLVLCWLRKKKTNKEEEENLVNLGLVDYVPQVENNIALPNQEDQEEVDLTGFANHNDMLMMSNQEYQEEDGFTGFADKIENMMMLEGEYEQQQQQGQDQGDEDSELDKIPMMSDEEFFQWSYLNEDHNDIISVDVIKKFLDETT